jgi:response regulator RpfG family c-di-GMP phosphodiesterase
MVASNDGRSADGEQFFAFDDDEPQTAVSSMGPPWKIMVVDDDEEVHSVSRMVLRDFMFQQRPVQLIMVNSAEEARRKIVEHADTAIILLDVVMESDNAGLDFVRYVREELLNRFVRIILRTGQPGHAPEQSVMIDYDINDYKEKTELTAKKLVTTVVAALRSFNDIQTLEASRRGLEKIIESSRGLYERRSLARFSGGVIEQLVSLLHLGADGLLAQPSGFAAHCNDRCGEREFFVVAGHGSFAGQIGRNLGEIASPETLRLIERARQQGLLIEDGCFVGCFKASNGFENVLFFQVGHELSQLDSDLLEVFLTNVGIAFDNVHLNEELSETQTEIIHMLAELVETRSHETGRHVHRVGAYSRLLGELLELSPRDIELLAIAAPMHDIGKIGITDDLLNKPGKLNEEEFRQIQKHTLWGGQLLETYRRPGLNAAAIVARQHHERWDGSGYPDGLSGEDIHIYSRIVAVIDVFDALCQARSYKPAWSIDEAHDYIVKQSGAAFDPAVVTAFSTNIDQFIAIAEAMSETRRA